MGYSRILFAWWWNSREAFFWRYMLAVVLLIAAISEVLPGFRVRASSISVAAYNLVESAGAPLLRRSTLNFTGGGVSVSDAGGKTVVNIAGGGGGAAYATVEDEGIALTQRTTLNFSGSAVACSDDVVNSRTNCAVSGGGGGGGGAAMLTGAFSAIPACASSQFIFSVLQSPLVAYCDGLSGLTLRAVGQSFPGAVLLNSSFTDTVGGSATYAQSAAGPMTADIGGFTTTEGRIRARPVGDFVATLYFAGDVSRNVGSGGTVIQGVLATNAARTKAVFAAYQWSGGQFRFGTYTCNPIDNCVGSGETFFGTLPQQFLIARLTVSGSTALGSYSLDGGITFIPIGGIFISSIDDVSFIGVGGRSAFFTSSQASYYALQVQ